MCRSQLRAQWGGPARRRRLRLTNGFGSGQLTVVPFPTPPQTALHTWELTFGLSVLGADGGAALSVGDVPSIGLGATGGGAQLRVRLRPGMEELDVSWEGDLLAAVPIPPPRATAVSNASITPSATPPSSVARVARIGVDPASGKEHVVVGAAWRWVRIAYLEDGLHASVDGTAVLAGLTLRRYRASPGWRLAFSAAAGDNYGRLWVRRLALRTDAAVYNATLPLALSLNGRQFSAAVGSFEYTAHPFRGECRASLGPHWRRDARAHPRPRLRRRSQRAPVPLRRRRRRAGERHAACGHRLPRLHHAASPPGRPWASQRLGRAAPPQPADGERAARAGRIRVHSDALRCRPHTRAPEWADGRWHRAHSRHRARGGDRAAEVALLAPHCRFDLRDQRLPERELELMRLQQVALLASPVGFNASVSIPPALTVAATLAPATGLRCVAPRIELPFARLVSGVGAALPVSLSLNGQQYVDVPRPLFIYEPPQLEMVSPACGPVAGGTTLAIIGSQLGLRLGMETIAAGWARWRRMRGAAPSRRPRPTTRALRRAS